MKNTKNVFRLIFCLVLTLVVMLSVVSCDTIEDTFNKIFDKHEHEYTATVTPATCTEKGFTTYTCECGDSYVDEYTDPEHRLVTHPGMAPTCTQSGYDTYQTCLKCTYTTYHTLTPLGHDYEEKVTRFPTTLTTGVKSKLCAACGIHEDTVIDAVTVSLPGVAETLKNFIGNNKTVINARDTDIILVKQIDTLKTNGEYVGTNYEETYIAIQLAYVEINGEGEKLYANIDVDFGYAQYDDCADDKTLIYESQCALNIIVNGEDVSLAITENEESTTDNFILTELFYELIEENTGYSYETFAELSCLITEAVDCLPLVEGVLGLFNTLEVPEGGLDAETLVDYMMDALVSVDGNKYTVDFSGLTELLESIKGKPVAELIDENYGEGTMAKLEDLILSLPNRKLRDVVDSVIFFSDECGVSIDDVYALVNWFVYSASGTDFNIESEIITRYDNTVAEVVAELTGADAAELAEEFVTGAQEIIDILRTNDIDSLYNLMEYGDANYTTEDSVKFSCIDYLVEGFTQLPECIKITWTLDDNGEVTLFDVKISEIIPVEVSFNYTLGADGAYTAVFTVEDEYSTFSFNAAGNPENPFSASVIYVDKETEATLFKGQFKYNDYGIEGKTLEFKGYEDDELVALIRVTAVETETGLNVTWDVEGLTVRHHFEGEPVYEPSEPGDEGYVNGIYPWTTTTLRIRMSENSDSQQLPSSCRRYLAGDLLGNENDFSTVDDYVSERNEEALKHANVYVEYSYYPDTAMYDWGQTIDHMHEEVMCRDPERPDIYVNFVYDMSVASLKGTFANLYSATMPGRFTGSEHNYFAFEDDLNYMDTGRDYMYEYMRSLTLSKYKMYLLASDYFVDMVRAFYVVPVNIGLLETIMSTQEEGQYNSNRVTTFDWAGNEELNYTIEDFYQLVWDLDWTYETLAKFSDTIFQEGAYGNEQQDLNDRLGFALNSSSGLAVSGMLYTTSISIIDREYNLYTGDYTYSYPYMVPVTDASGNITSFAPSEYGAPDELVNFCGNLTELLNANGVIAVNNQDAANIGHSNAIQAVRAKFANNDILFGGVVTLGSLEYDEYREMNGQGRSGYGIVPIPLYRSGSYDRYLTAIHSNGKIGAISYTTEKFAQCTAYLNYQSTHSNAILNEYYDYKLQYDVVGTGAKDNIEMLRYLRQNVRSTFDMTFENAIAAFYSGIDETSVQNKWHTMIKDADFQLSADEMIQRYLAAAPLKAWRLYNLENDVYPTLPN